MSPCNTHASAQTGARRGRHRGKPTEIPQHTVKWQDRHTSCTDNWQGRRAGCTVNWQKERHTAGCAPSTSNADSELATMNVTCVPLIGKAGIPLYAKLIGLAHAEGRVCSLILSGSSRASSQAGTRTAQHRGKPARQEPGVQQFRRQHSRVLGANNFRLEPRANKQECDHV